jgi:hypothetical protein
MAVPFFSDIYKLFYYATKLGPYETAHDDDNIEGVGIGSPDAKWNLQNASWGGPQSPTLIQIADSQDYIDLSTVTNRKARYKEYDRLEVVPEIYTALNTFADESCLAGETKIATPFGFISIQEKAETCKEGEQFLVYCWDFEKNDFSLGWAYDPRLVKKAETVEVSFDNGKSHVCTPDHRFLTLDNQWVCAGDLQQGMPLKAFYRLPANPEVTKMKTKQFPRIFTYRDGWMHERQLLDEWKSAKRIDKYQKLNKISRHMARGLHKTQLIEAADMWWRSIEGALRREGFSYREMLDLNANFAKERTVVRVKKHKEVDVYDLSVEGHENFATDCTIVHNCQTNDKGYVFQVSCSNEEVKEESDFLVHRLLGMDDRAWGIERNLCKYGDQFFEIIIDPQNPKRGVLKLQVLPADSMYRIETVKGRLVEFQQSQEGPDYQSLSRVEITRASESELMQATALRFHPEQVVHAKIGDDRKTFYPYGISMIEAAKGPANQLRLMEDAMLVYRLTRAPERRVFYIDVGQIAPNRAEAMLDRLKDQFRKKKVFSNGPGGSKPGASGVEERWNPIPPDEDFFIAMRPNSQTRIDTLPGAENLGEIDDALYFRQRLFTALQFPKNYLTNEDAQATKLTLSQQDVRFARLIERLQKPFARAVQDVVLRHLKLRGYPQEAFADLEIKMTPPSDWRQINRNEVTEVLFNRAAAMKGSKLMSDYDIYMKILATAFNLDEQEAKDMIQRNRAQNMEDLKMQIIGANPESLGLVPMPADQGQQIGTGEGGPNPMLSPPGAEQQSASTPGSEQPPEGAPPGGPEGQGGPPPGPGGPGEEPPPDQGAPDGGQGPKPAPSPKGTATKLPKPSDDDIKKYDLTITGSKYMDEEETDVGEIGG